MNNGNRVAPPAIVSTLFGYKVERKDGGEITANE